MAGFCIVLLMMGFVFPVLIIAVMIFLTVAIITIFNYFMESFALYHLCKNSNYKHPGLAWIPYYNRVILGNFADNKKMGNITFILNIAFLILFFVFICFIDYIPEGIRDAYSTGISIISLITYVLNIILVHLIMKKSIPKVADILTVINVFTFGICKAIILFVLRNNDKILKDKDELYKK